MTSLVQSVSFLLGLTFTSVTPGGSTPVLVTMGGLFSCGWDGDLERNPPYGGGATSFFDLSRESREALGRQLNGGALGEITTCYAFDASRGVFYVSNLDGSERVEQASEDEMVSQIERLVRRVPNPELVVVGYSYGGWTAMFLARHLDPSIPIRALVTLDPISKVECTADRFFPALHFLQPAPECTRAPRDFSPDELNALADRVGSWANYYELDSPYLHADAIVASPKIENIQRCYDAPGVFSAHRLMSTDPAVREDVIRRFERALFSRTPSGSG